MVKVINYEIPYPPSSCRIMRYDLIERKKACMCKKIILIWQYYSLKLFFKADTCMLFSLLLNLTGI